MFRMKQALTALVTAAIAFHLSPAAADNDKPVADPVTLLVKFHANGTFAGMDPQTGQMSYLISAKGYVPRITDDAVVVGRPHQHRPIAKLTGAKITFDYFDFTAPPATVNFTCEGCKLTFRDGSVLQSDSKVPLQGRALFVYGPVNFDPANPTAQTIRMAGCAGLHETAGKGSLAGKVGSICFNGVFNFDMSNPMTSLQTITGASDCTITMHTPVPH